MGSEVVNSLLIRSEERKEVFIVMGGLSLALESIRGDTETSEVLLIGTIGREKSQVKDGSDVLIRQPLIVDDLFAGSSRFGREIDVRILGRINIRVDLKDSDKTSSLKSNGPV